MMDTLSNESFTATGVVEHTDLTDVDRAVAGFFAGVFDRMTVTDTDRKTNQEFARYVSRNPRNKIIFGTAETPEALLLHAAKKGDLLSKGDLLPLLCIGRSDDLAFTGSDSLNDLSCIGTIDDESGTTIASVNKSFVSLTYNLTILAFNKPTISRLSVGIGMWLRHVKAGRQHVFNAKTSLAGSEAAVQVVIEDPKSIVGESISLSFEDNRVFGVQFQIPVIAEVLEAEGVDVTEEVFIVNETEYHW